MNKEKIIKPKIQVFNLPQFKEPFVIIELRDRVYSGFYLKPKIHWNPKIKNPLLDQLMIKE